MFQTLHLMFETQYNELALAVDLIAERIRSLGSRAPGSYCEFAAMSSVAEDGDLPDATEMIRRRPAHTTPASPRKDGVDAAEPARLAKVTPWAIYAL